MNEQDEVQQNNMISNLPLLFANGYPTSLDKITEAQLEKFIPFMVQCSLGHINLQSNVECSEPEWWPEDIPFNIPLTKPKKYNGNWMEKMKEVVIICYQFHKSVFLLRFCADLASYEHASLRFINNYNSTTSLFDRRSNKLLVTFRNENMSYDQPSKTRKCLLQQKSKSGYRPDHDASQQQIMVEPAPFDIYLCDYCDAELYSKDAILEHEKTCNNDDDVILCDSSDDPEADVQNINPLNDEDDELRKRFLLNFNLRCTSDKNNGTTDTASSALNSSFKEDSGPFAAKKTKRLPKRNRTVHSLARCPTIPLSSPAGLHLVRSTKTSVGEGYLAERLERVERFCFTPLLSKNQTKPRYFEKKTAPEPHCTFKKPSDYSSHIYTFPRRQFSHRRKPENFVFLNSLLIKRCKPISVRVKKLNPEQQENKTVSKNTLTNCNLNIKLTRDISNQDSGKWKISQNTASADKVVETIDLCSSEDEETTGAGLPNTNKNIVYDNVNSNAKISANQSSGLVKKILTQNIVSPSNKLLTPVNVALDVNKPRVKKISRRNSTAPVGVSNPIANAPAATILLNKHFKNGAENNALVSLPKTNHNSLKYINNNKKSLNNNENQNEMTYSTAQYDCNLNSTINHPPNANVFNNNNTTFSTMKSTNGNIFPILLNPSLSLTGYKNNLIIEPISNTDNLVQTNTFHMGLYDQRDAISGNSNIRNKLPEQINESYLQNANNSLNLQNIAIITPIPAANSAASALRSSLPASTSLSSLPSITNVTTLNTGSPTANLGAFVKKPSTTFSKKTSLASSNMVKATGTIIPPIALSSTSLSSMSSSASTTATATATMTTMTSSSGSSTINPKPSANISRKRKSLPDNIKN